MILIVVGEWLKSYLVEMMWVVLRPIPTPPQIRILPTFNRGSVREAERVKHQHRQR